MKKYLSNAFSLNMIDVTDVTLVRVKKVEPLTVPQDAVSAIGHADTARVVSSILGFDVPACRQNIHLEKDDILYVAQYVGPRLQEGATELPQGAHITFLKVEIEG